MRVGREAGPPSQVLIFPPSGLNGRHRSRNIEYGSSYDQIEQINCRIPHIAGYFGQGVRVLYLDTGYELGHTAYDSLNLIAQYDFVNNDENTANETDQEVTDNQDDEDTHEDKGVLHADIAGAIVKLRTLGKFFR